MTISDTEARAGTIINREHWLTHAAFHLRPLFAEHGFTVPEFRVSCGFPRGNARKLAGQCWPTKSAAGVAQVFINPTMSDPLQVLGTLAHEMAHVVDDCQNGHRAPFGRIARPLGLEGKLTATVPGETLTGQLRDVAAELGDYPHASITLADGTIKAQTTRMIKVICAADGYTLRTTRQWLDVGLPSCPCGETMREAS